MKVGIIGLGSIAKKHVAALQQITAGAAKFYALRRAPQGSVAHPDAIDVYTLDELMAHEPDFVVVSNPTALHYAAIKEFERYPAVPLFIEKPLFDRLYELPHLPNRTYVACNLRFLACLQYVKQHVAGAERINEVSAYCGSYLPEWRAGVDWRKNYSANADMGGGVHLDLIHELDYLYWLFGRPDGVQRTLRNRSSLAVSAVDYAHYVLEYPDFAASVTLNYYRPKPKRTLEVVTDKNIYKVDLLANTVERNGCCVFCSEQTVADTYKDQMAHFLQGQEAFNDTNEAYEVLTICLP